MGIYSIPMLCGIVMSAAGIWWILARSKCRCEVTGTFVRLHSLSAPGIKKYSPVFRFMYDGKELEHQAMESLSKRRSKEFVPGEPYCLYVDAKKPTKFVISGKVQFSEWLLVFVGAVLIVISCVGMLSQ